MLLSTNHSSAPWTVIRANNKKLAHLNLIRDLLSRIDYPGKKSALLTVDPDVVIKWSSNAIKLPKLEK